MSNNPTRTAILDHPRVRALRPEWWRHSEIVTRCENTKQPCEIEREDLGYGDYISRCTSCCEPCPCDDHTYDTEEPVDPPRYTGPDLSRPDQLHELLGLADDLCKPPHRTNVEWNIGDEEFCAHFNSYCGYGPTRADAVIAAIARALEVSHASHVS